MVKNRVNLVCDGPGLSNWLNTSFLPFFAKKISIFDDFSKWSSAPMIFQSGVVHQTHCGTLKNHQKWQKIKKSLVKHAFNPFLALTSGCKNPLSET